VVGASGHGHHDESNTLLCQVLGRKVVRLVPPTMLDVVDSARGFHATLTASEVASRQPGACYEVTLEERDCVFIPVGWWHEVVSLTPSLSLAVVNFRKPNHYGYVPGLPRSKR
jgi:ribosomal protein L16 Arg81 hydroxylase